MTTKHTQTPEYREPQSCCDMTEFNAKAILSDKESYGQNDIEAAEDFMEAFNAK